VRGQLSTELPSTRRSLALTLHRFVHGDLAGLFDGENDPLVFGGALTVVDLSAQWSTSTLSVAALSAVAAAQHLVSSGAVQGYLVLDEAWALLSDPHALRWLQGSWKLARARGLSHVLVLHRWSDVVAAGDAGTAHRERARGLLRECETSWLFRQPPDEAREMALALALHPREERYLSGLSKGTVLVRYGVHRSVVRVTPDARDGQFIDTDAAMRLAES
jgi:type IV secretory pathway VirB4 component